MLQLNGKDDDEALHVEDVLASWLMAAADGDAAPQLLQRCITEKRIDVLCSILSQLKNQPNFQAEVDGILPNGGTLLHYAVAEDNVDAINALLANGVNPCVQNDSGKTSYQVCQSDQAKNAFIQEIIRAITMSKY